MLIERLAQMYAHWGDAGPRNESTRHRDQTIASVHQFFQAIEDSSEDRKQLFTQSQQSRRKAIKLAYLLLASESEPAAIRDAYLRSGLLSEGQRGIRADVLMWLSGTMAIARGMHPYIAFLIMTAFFGPETAEKEFQWLRERAIASEMKLEEFIVPGDLTDFIEEAIQEPTKLQHTMRLAGMPLAASAFSGCSLYYIEKILALMGPVGAHILSEMMESARKRLVSDEISTAQQAFIDLYSQEKTETSESEGGFRNEIETRESSNLPDPDLIRTATNIVMAAEAKVLKTTLSSMSDKEIASLLRCIEALAHERLLSLISPGRQKRVLSVIQKTGDRPSSPLLRDAQLFAQKLLATYAPKNLKPGETLSIPDKVRGLISSLLSRE